MTARNPQSAIRNLQSAIAKHAPTCRYRSGVEPCISKTGALRRGPRTAAEARHPNPWCWLNVVAGSRTGSSCSQSSLEFSMRIREIHRSDAEAVAAIYNEGIRGRGATFQTEERSVA